MSTQSAYSCQLIHVPPPHLLKFNSSQPIYSLLTGKKYPLTHNHPKYASIYPHSFPFIPQKYFPSPDLHLPPPTQTLLLFFFPHPDSSRYCSFISAHTHQMLLQVKSPKICFHFLHLPKKNDPLSSNYP